MSAPTTAPAPTRTRLQIWMLAARPRTLPAAAAPVIAGSAAAFYEGAFRLGPALAALLGALLLQIGANLANDVFDYQKGADTHERLGPLRVTQAGLLAPRQVMAGMWVVFGLAALCGLYLTWSAGWPVIAIGVLSILAAMAYTGGPYPLGYNGLGEVFVFIFFGLAATAGTYFVQAGRVSPLAWAASIPMGLLIVAILVVNNLRDIATDRATGKRTQAVRHGEAWTKAEWRMTAALAFATPPAVIALGLAGWPVLLAWLAAPLALSISRALDTTTGRPLNRELARTGQLVLLFGVLLAAGLVLERLLAAGLGL